MITNEQIAELLGWEYRYKSWISFNECFTGWKTPDEKYTKILPDFIHSLDLVHDELEARLTVFEQIQYERELMNLLQIDWDEESEDVTYFIPFEQLFKIKNADALTCCTAWAKVKGWKE